MLQVNSIMIYVIQKLLVLLKITRVLTQFLRSIIDLKNMYIFSQHVIMESSRFAEDKNVED